MPLGELNINFLNIFKENNIIKKIAHVQVIAYYMKLIPKINKYERDGFNFGFIYLL